MPNSVIASQHLTVSWIEVSIDKIIAGMSHEKFINYINYRAKKNEQKIFKIILNENA
jgi:hypothetical protein